jgi:hypothetical protein
VKKTLQLKLVQSTAFKQKLSDTATTSICGDRERPSIHDIDRRSPELLYRLAIVLILLLDMTVTRNRASASSREKVPLMAGSMTVKKFKAIFRNISAVRVSFTCVYDDIAF